MFQKNNVATHSQENIDYDPKPNETMCND